MAEVVQVFEQRVTGDDGTAYEPRACGRAVEGREIWEGWVEFVPLGEGPVLRTRRETTQPNREGVAYWASGLSRAFFEGALRRALEPIKPAEAPPSVAPAYDGPAPNGGPQAIPARPRAVLDPFEVYAEGEDILRKQLRAFEVSHLRNIIRAHDLADESQVDLDAMSRAGLGDLIVAAVRRRAT